MSSTRPPPDASASPPVVSRRNKLVFSVIVTLLALGIVEVGWRIYAGRQYRRKKAEYESTAWEEDELLGNKYRVGDWNEEPVGYRINSLHLRGPDVAQPKPAESIRILCLGGSTTFGTYCKTDDMSYPGQLQTMLRAADPGQRYEVINAGVPTYRTVESYHNLDRLRDLDPDIVVVHHAINDIIWGVDEPFYLDPTSKPRPESRLGKRRREASSFFFEALYHRVFHRRVENPKGRMEVDPKILGAFGDNLRRIANLAVEIGARPVFVTFEARLEADFAAPVRQAIESQSPFRLTHMTYDGLIGALAQFNEKTRSIAREFGTEAIELEHRLPEDEKYWPDFVHLTGEGTRLKTEIIYQGILPIVARVKAARADR